MKNRLLSIISASFLISCASSKGDKNNGQLVLADEDLSKASASICPPGQRLALTPSEKHSVEEMVPAIALISGDEACANARDIHDLWYDPQGHKWSIEVAFSATCPENHSIWVISSQENSDTEVVYRYTNLKGDQEIALHSTPEMGATYARDHAGLRMMKCQ